MTTLLSERSPAAGSCHDAADPVRQLTEQGYASLGRILDEQELELLRQDEARLRAGLEIDAAAHARTLFLNNVCWRAPDTRRFVQEGRHLALLERMIGPDLLLWWTQIVNKLPETTEASSVFPWHQDCGYLDIAPAPLTVWVALDQTTLENGCLWVVPGSHLGGIRAHARPNAESWHLTVPVTGDGIALPMQPGEAVVFTGHTLHRSLANRSGQPRRAFFCEYAQPSAREAKTGRPLLPERDILMVRGRA